MYEVWGCGWVVSRRGHLEAARKQIRGQLGVRHSILVKVHHLLQGEPSQDLGGDFFDRQDPERTMRRLVKGLEALGQQVTPTPQDTAA